MNCPVLLKQVHRFFEAVMEKNVKICFNSHIVAEMRELKLVLS